MSEMMKMPEPVGEAFYDHVHKNGLIERRKTHIYTADQMRAFAQEAARHAEPLPQRNVLRHLVDVVWNEATESTAVPDTPWADRMIDKALGTNRDDENEQEGF